MSEEQARHWARPFTQVLELQPAGPDRFAAHLDGFGAITLGCATLAAALSTDRTLHALRAWFLRPVSPERPAEIAVERVRDGRRFAQRRVSVASGGQPVCEMLASFANRAEGLEAQDERLDPAVPPPEALPTEQEIARAEGWDLVHKMKS